MNITETQKVHLVLYVIETLKRYGDVSSIKYINRKCPDEIYKNWLRIDVYNQPDIVIGYSHINGSDGGTVFKLPDEYITGNPNPLKISTVTELVDVLQPWLLTNTFGHGVITSLLAVFKAYDEGANLPVYHLDALPDYVASAVVIVLDTF